jgi:hypothetical protein
LALEDCGRDYTLAQELRSLSGRHRAAEVEALDARAPGVYEKVKLGGGLDAFGDDLDVKFSREADRCSDDGRATMIARQTVHKLLHDLGSADMIGEQIFKGGTAGAEVVDRNSHAERSQPVDAAAIAIAVSRFHEQRFGQLEFELSGIQVISA